MNAQKWYTLERYGKSFGESKKWYWFMKNEVDHDKFAAVNYRVVPAGGVGYWFKDQDESKLLLEIGNGWEYTDYSDERQNESNYVLMPRVFFEKLLLKGVRISEDIIFYPTFSKTAGYRFRSVTYITLDIHKGLAVRFSLIDEYNSAPALGKQKNDMQLIASGVYGF
jgi:putative salt-induced outer membrane protein YdiY